MVREYDVVLDRGISRENKRRVSCQLMAGLSGHACLRSCNRAIETGTLACVDRNAV